MPKSSKPPKVTIFHEVQCDVCKHEVETRVFYEAHTLVVDVPKGWTAVAQDDFERGGLTLTFWCEGHKPELSIPPTG